MEDLIEIQGGEVLASLEDRTITGLLVPYGEVGRTNVGMFEVQAGVIPLPEDPSVVTLNIDHDRYQPVGRATRVWEEAKGIMASFSIARTPAGDAALADATSPTGKRRRLSGEFRTGIKGGKATGGHPLSGGALVELGAFASAMVLAADTPDPEDDATRSSRYVSEYTDENGVTWRRVEETTSTTTATDTGTQTTTETTVTEETTGEKEAPVGAETTTEVLAGAVPATIIPGNAPAATTQERTLFDVQAIFNAIGTLRNPLVSRTSPEAVEAHDVLAALQPITVGGTNPLIGAGVLQPGTWVGQIAQGIPYVREYINLCNLGNDITLGGKKGYKLKRGTSGSPVTGNFDGTWAGNKSAVNSYKGFTTPHTSVLDKFAIAEDIGREFRDLAGGAEFVAAFLNLVIEDCYVWSDLTALSYIVETAGTPVAPATAKYPDNYPAAMGHLIQGILALRKKKADGRRDTPSFAIMNDLDYEEIVYAAGGPENLPEFVSISMSTAGVGSADGVQIVNGDVGIEDTGATLVGANYAIDFDEPTGGPLQINALDLANGGVDEAVHGYLQTFVKRPEAIVLIGTADA